MSGVGNKFYWRGDEETASIYRPDGKIIATACKRDSSDECASTRAIEVTTALNNNHFSRVKPLEWEGKYGDPGHDIRANPTPDIQYVVRHLDHCRFDVILQTDIGSKWFRDQGEIHATYNEAKVAAQADYERRILSALE